MGFIEDDFQQVFRVTVFILMVQTINLMQDKQSRMNYSFVLSTYDS